MKIIFDLRNVGLGPNGGSLTLIKSGNALHDMGHKVTFIDSGRNQNTWEKLKPQHIIVKNEQNIPSADAIIATGYKSVGPTVKAPKRCGVKAIWIRAWETWQMPTPKIIEKVLKQPIVKIVNSVCLHNELLRHGDFPSHIIRPGYDFEHLFPRSIRQFNKVPIIGGLYRSGIHGNRKRTHWLYDTVRVLRDRGIEFKFWMFGSEKRPDNSDMIDRYLCQPTMEEKNDFYNYIDIWMSSSESEGLHLPPAEAMLTGCPSVGTNAKLSGTQDYLENNVTGIVTDNNLNSFINGAEYLLQNPHKRKIFGSNAIKKVHEIGNRRKNMIKMVSLFRKLIEESK
jgi:glycosyltransferase involved in cell wall biosynthesis